MGYDGFLPEIFSDANGGWPMIQDYWDQSKFQWEKVAGDNLRRFVSDTMLGAFPYLDTFDTTKNVLYVSILAKREKKKLHLLLDRAATIA